MVACVAPASPAGAALRFGSVRSRQLLSVGDRLTRVAVSPSTETRLTSSRLRRIGNRRTPTLAW